MGSFEDPLQVGCTVGCPHVSLLQVLCAGRRVFIYELASSVTSSCLLSSAASGWCWRKGEALSLYMNYRPPLTIQKAAFTCLRKIRWSRLRLGLSGDWHLSRSGERDPSAPKTFSSSKHPVSITYRRGQLRFCWGQRSNSLWKYLILPGDGNAACIEFGVEVFVRLVQSDSSQCGKLIDVQHVAAVHVPGLHQQKSQPREPNKFSLASFVLLKKTIKSKRGGLELTSGLNGGSTSPASSILKLIFLKKGCDWTSLPPELWQPSLCFGFLVSSCSSKKPCSSHVLTGSLRYHIWLVNSPVNRFVSPRG